MKKARLIVSRLCGRLRRRRTWIVLHKPAAAARARAGACRRRRPPTEQVLVATHELNFGSVLQPAGREPGRTGRRICRIQGVIRKSETPQRHRRRQGFGGARLLPRRRTASPRKAVQGQQFRAFSRPSLAPGLSRCRHQHRGQRRDHRRQFHPAQRPRRRDSHLPRRRRRQDRRGRRLRQRNARHQRPRARHRPERAGQGTGSPSPAARRRRSSSIRTRRKPSSSPSASASCRWCCARCRTAKQAARARHHGQETHDHAVTVVRAGIATQSRGK